MVNENLADLQAKCDILDLEVKPTGKKLGKADYVRVLRNHFLREDFPSGNLPYEEVTPMLCFAEWNLKPAEQAELWKDDNRWVVQKKFNGCRCVIHFIKGVGVFAHSRTVSVKTYRMEAMHDSFLWRDFIPDFTATIDTEIIIEKPIDTAGYSKNKKKGEKTKSSLHSVAAALHLEPEAARRLQVDQDAPFMFYIFDIMNYEGQDLRNKSLKERYEVLMKKFIFKLADHDISGKYFRTEPLVSVNKRKYFEDLLAAGWEGIIAKNLDSTYEDSSSRNRSAWVKVKKRVEYDAFVIGFEPGDPDKGFGDLVGNFKFGVHTDKGGVHWLGSPSNMTLEFRRAITEKDPNGKPVLRQEWYGRVAEISGQDVSAREFRLSHCTLDRWRPVDGPDAKRAEDCKVRMSDLKEAAAWVG